MVDWRCVRFRLPLGVEETVELTFAPSLPRAGAAHSATHCSVFAQLIVKGQVYGTKTFIVPLREPKTYQLLPGVAIGDIGKKMGRDGIDNGWM